VNKQHNTLTCYRNSCT